MTGQLKNYEKRLFEGCSPDLVEYLGFRLKQVSSDLSTLSLLLSKEYFESASELSMVAMNRACETLDFLEDAKKFLLGEDGAASDETATAQNENADLPADTTGQPAESAEVAKSEEPKLV